MGKCREFNQDMYMCFVDYTKAFDSVKHEQLFTVLKEMGFPETPTKLIHNLYLNQQKFKNEQ